MKTVIPAKVPVRIFVELFLTCISFMAFGLDIC